MRIPLLCSILIMLFSAGSAHTLSCASIEGAEDNIPQNELIVRAKVVNIATTPHIPLIQKAEDQPQIITFEIIDIYKAPESMSKTFKARFSHFFKAWGPYLKEGNEGEYLFDKDATGWTYAGPGGCTFYSEKAWAALRKNAVKP